MPECNKDERTPNIGESRALMGTHEAPVRVVRHPLHEQVGYPQSVEQVAGPLLILQQTTPGISPCFRRLLV